MLDFKHIIHSAKKKRIISLTVIYIVLAGIGFVYLYPILYMVVNSFFSRADLLDPAVIWIPTELSFENFVAAFKTLDFIGCLFLYSKTRGLSAGSREALPMNKKKSRREWNKKKAKKRRKSKDRKVNRKVKK